MAPGLRPGRWGGGSDHPQAGRGPRARPTASRCCGRGAWSMAGRSPGVTTPSTLAAAMIGQRIAPGPRSRGREADSGPGPDLVRADPVGEAAGSPAPPWYPRGGEIVAIAAVEGNGQRELLRGLAGLAPGPRGRLGRRAGSPSSRRTGLPKGLIPSFTLTENVVLGPAGPVPVDPAGRGSTGRRPRGSDRGASDGIWRSGRPGRTLRLARSAGAISRRWCWPGRSPASRRVLVAEDPTGVWISVPPGTSTIAPAGGGRRAGAAVLLYSSDLDEVLALGDRVVVDVARARSARPPRRRLGQTIGEMMVGGGAAESAPALRSCRSCGAARARWSWQSAWQRRLRCRRGARGPLDGGLRLLVRAHLGDPGPVGAAHRHRPGNRHRLPGRGVQHRGRRPVLRRRHRGDVGGPSCRPAGRPGSRSRWCWLAGALAGALWVAVPVILRLRFGVLEVISTLLLNFVAEALVSWMVQGPLQEATADLPAERPDPACGPAPAVSGDPAASGFAWRSVLAVASWVIFARTDPVGLPASGGGCKARGRRQISGRHRCGRVMGAVALLWSGALAGLAGGIEVTGVTYALFQNLSPGYGFTRDRGGAARATQSAGRGGDRDSLRGAGGRRERDAAGRRRSGGGGVRGRGRGHHRGRCSPWPAGGRLAERPEAAT